MTAPTDQTINAQAKPSLVPSQSIIRPANSMEIAYTTWKTITMFA